MAKKYTKSEIEGMIKNLKEKEKKARSKWGKAVLQDAQWLLENVIEGYDEPYELSEKLVLNGAENWNQFSWGGSALVYNGEIAEHYSTPSEAKNFWGLTKDGGVKRDTNTAGEHLLDIQARALRQAWWAIRDEMNGTTEFSMSLCEFEEKKGKSNFEIEEDEILELKQEHGQEYLQEQRPDDMIYQMGEIDELFSSAWDALRGAFFGGRYGYDQDSFNPNDDYFYFNGYGNLVSVPYLDEYLDNEIDDDNFIEWCKEQGYYEENEDDDDDDDEGEDKDNMSIHELSAQHDARKSFYGKAQVNVDDKTGVQTLYSYGTKVAQYNPKTKKFTAYPEAKYSATTKRHVREFMKQNGVPASEFSIIDDTKDVIKATGKLAGNIVKNTTDKGGLLMF